MYKLKRHLRIMKLYFLRKQQMKLQGIDSGSSPE